MKGLNIESFPIGGNYDQKELLEHITDETTRNRYYMTISQIACKDCNKWFLYSADAAERDRQAGKTPPERCPECRPKHRREYSVLGCSHMEVLQLRHNGHGGLGHYKRPRPEPKTVKPEALEIEPFPIEAVVGRPDQPDTLLYGILKGSRRVHLVVGPTGSGKSTWLPYRLVSCSELIRKGPICVTEPRIPATEGPASFVGKLYYGNLETDSDSKEMRTVGPGMIVGYRHSEVGKSMTDSANRIIFMTDGTLLNEIKSGEVEKYSVVMIDEAHERSVNIDVILSLLKHKLSQIPHLHVVIASATVDSEGFKSFFGGNDKVACYYSDGFTYPILEVFSDETPAHWPGFSPGLDKPIDQNWEVINDVTIEKNILGPAPCYRFSLLDDFRLRYYPQFETLIYQGVMDEPARDRLFEASPKNDWRKAIETLYELSRRKRTLNDQVMLSISESIRGKIKVNNQGATLVPPEVQNRLLSAAMDMVVFLVARDETEAVHRNERWKRRECFEWPRLKKPGKVGHIIVFLPTTRLMQMGYEILSQTIDNLPGENRLFCYHREASQREKDEVAAESSPEQPVRKIILATPLAETSLTLDGLVYVIDTGLILETYYNADKKTDDYPTILHSKAGCRQRLGRTGRKEPGEGYRLYTREELQQHPAFTMPEIARSSPEQLIMTVVSAGLDPAFVKQEGALMQPPQRRWLSEAQKDLERFQALDKDGDLTAKGDELLHLSAGKLSDGILLVEADRFGCLWEMAIFLCFIRLKSEWSPDGKSKWLALWEPDSGPIFEDQISNDSDNIETVVLDDASLPRNIHPAWHNPYYRGNALLKQRVLRDGVLDDLELYLRIWQAWYRHEDNTARRSWAINHGVSHDALKRVERDLGLDPENSTEQGMLKKFWALDQKGRMIRDVDFDMLDKVRYLYAASAGDRIYKYDSGGAIQPVFKKINQKLTIHMESVWAKDASWKPLKHNESVQLSYFTCGTHAGKKLRHIVWLDPEWIKDGQRPDFKANSLDLWRCFAPSADLMHCRHGQWPFATGAEMCGLAWPMPMIEDPEALRKFQWRIRYQNDIGRKRIYLAKVVEVITWPKEMQPLIFVQLVSGPLLPSLPAADGDFPAIGASIDTRLVEKNGMIWAEILPYQKSEKLENEEEMVGEPFKTSHPKPDTAAPKNEHSFSEHPLPPIHQKPIRLNAKDAKPFLPKNSIVKAKFIEEKNRFFQFVLELPDGNEFIAGIPSTGPLADKLRKEMRPNRQCAIKVRDWIKKNDKTWPFILIQRWL